MTECDYIDVCCVASLSCLCLGIIFSSLGLVINTQYKIDVIQPAREAEKMEQYYSRLILFLQFCDIFGISLVATGACLLILVVVVMAIKGELYIWSRDNDVESSRCHDKQGLPLLRHSTPLTVDRHHGYGSNLPVTNSGNKE